MILLGAGHTVSAQQREDRKVIKSDTLVASVAVSKDGALVASYDNGRGLKLWNARTGALVRKLANTEKLDGSGPGLVQVVISPDGKTLATADGKSGTFSLWEVATGKKKISVKTELREVHTVAFAPDGKGLATGGVEPKVKLWDMTGKEVRALATEESIKGLAFSQDGKRLAATGGGPIYVWDLESGDRKATLANYYKNMSSTFAAVALSSDGKKVAMGGTGREGSDKTPIEIWDVESSKLESTLPGHLGFITAVSFRPDGKVLVSGGGLDKVILWDLASGKELRALEGGATSLGFSGDGYILAWTSGWEIIIWSGR